MGRRRLRSLVLVTMVVAVAGACGDADSHEVDAGTEVVDLGVGTPTVAEAVTLNAVNQLGWTDVAPEDWVRLSLEACEAGAWDPAVASDVAARFLDENGLPDRPEAEMLPAVIWLNLHVVCPNDVPAGAEPPEVLFG